MGLWVACCVLVGVGFGDWLMVLLCRYQMIKMNRKGVVVIDGLQEKFGGLCCVSRLPTYLVGLFLSEVEVVGLWWS